jgi:hypothetical protein
MDYQQKYLKYKKKYLDLKIGGGISIIQLDYSKLSNLPNIMDLYNKITDFITMKDDNICKNKIGFGFINKLFPKEITEKYYRKEKLDNLIYHIMFGNKKIAKLMDQFILDSFESMIKNKNTIDPLANDIYTNKLNDLLQDETEILAFIVTTDNVETLDLHIQLICAKPGFGAPILEYLTNYAKSIDKEYISLDSITDKDTYNFYRKNGFYIDNNQYSANIKIYCNDNTIAHEIDLENKSYSDIMDIIKDSNKKKIEVEIKEDTSQIDEIFEKRQKLTEHIENYKKELQSVINIYMNTIRAKNPTKKEEKKIFKAMEKNIIILKTIEEEKKTEELDLDDIGTLGMVKHIKSYPLKFTTNKVVPIIDKRYGNKTDDMIQQIANDYYISK